ncbi:AraC family transcriptional regulator [Hymenobacter sp. ASUV-10]|uniref:AraC family transcriptional regulator n=1 Tax=Hymenobacter aranciens TaxID=3063996 RepID=A0ABT9BFS8_9BACT|nr:AraC family transcriptional regulator [Hymenobacter sp. ASUV-10]MDO7877110.1 AraC family transcriptional regulator [Hymenobacter sp. ASUV-10]
MLFSFGLRSSLLLPFVMPGLVAALWLLGRGWRRGTPTDGLLALLILLPTLNVAQWMLGYAGWYDSHDGYSTTMFYVPWQLGLALGPAYYLYFRSLTNQEFRLRPLRRHLGPGLAQLALFGAAALYDLLWLRGLRGQPLPEHYGTKGPAAVALDALSTPLALLGYALLLGYGLRMLADYRRYRRYLDDNFSDPERLRFSGLRQLLLLQLTWLGLNLLYTGLDAVLGPFSYDEAWNFFALRGGLIYGLIVVGIQANYAAASSPLRFDAAPAPVPPAAELPPVVLAVEAAPAAAAAALAPAPVAAAELTPELLALREKLLTLMATEQPWLEPELSLTELAHRLKAAPAQLSRTINAGCGQNFNDFVNSYRVRAAAARLADPRFAHYSLIGVALDCGFNSKSTFNRVFKKLMGHPPNEVARPKS